MHHFSVCYFFNLFLFFLCVYYPRMSEAIGGILTEKRAKETNAVKVKENVNKRERTSETTAAVEYSNVQRSSASMSLCARVMLLFLILKTNIKHSHNHATRTQYSHKKYLHTWKCKIIWSEIYLWFINIYSRMTRHLMIWACWWSRRA